MNCLEFQDRLNDFLDRKLGACQSDAAEQHLLECPHCRDMTELLGDSRISTRPEPPAGLTEAILRRTSGSTCESARGMLCDHVDHALPSVDAELMQLHVEACGDCRPLARALARMGEDLPAMAELDTDAHFIDDVLVATLPRRKRLARRLAAFQQGWSRLLQRPRLALEGAYLGSLVLLLIFWVPNSPLAAVPRRTLEMVRTNPMVELGDEGGPVAKLEARVSSGARRAWEATGHRVASTSGEMAADLSQRYHKVEGPRRDLRRHGADALDAALDADASAFKISLDRMGGDLSALWREMVSTPDSENQDNEAEPRC